MTRKIKVLILSSITSLSRGPPVEVWVSKWSMSVVLIQGQPGATPQSALAILETFSIATNQGQRCSW